MSCSGQQFLDGRAVGADRVEHGALARLKRQADALFEVLRRMADEGRSVIFISHKLDEVRADRARLMAAQGWRLRAVPPGSPAKVRRDRAQESG